MDWREKGALNHIKSQGSCSSSYVFSAISALESQYFLKKGEKVSVSFMKQQGGGDDDLSYPYVGPTNKECQLNLSNVAAKVSGYVKLTPGNETELKEAVKQE